MSFTFGKRNCRQYQVSTLICLVFFSPYFIAILSICSFFLFFSMIIFSISFLHHDILSSLHDTCYFRSFTTFLYCMVFFPSIHFVISSFTFFPFSLSYLANFFPSVILLLSFIILPNSTFTDTFQVMFLLFIVYLHLDIYMLFCIYIIIIISKSPEIL